MPHFRTPFAPVGKLRRLLEDSTRGEDFSTILAQLKLRRRNSQNPNTRPMINKIVIRDHSHSEWLSFAAPVDVLATHDAHDVAATLAEVQRRVHADNLYAAGYVSYEAASGFDSALKTLPQGEMPLLCFGLFTQPERLPELPTPAASDTPPVSWQMTLSQGDYLLRFEAIKRQIALGNTYQINFTLRQRGDDLIDPWQFFLRVASVAPYSAYIETDQHAIISTSPELFFRLHGDRLTCQPMKGTAARGMTLADDLAARETLYHSVKNRAENVMVTDMLRNDMGRVSVPGSVQVESLYDVAKYPTLWQMTSTVTATTHASITEIFSALFPCASITGAPKASSMAIISELEDSPREVYTGAIGYFSANKEAQFSVAIRTAIVDKRSNAAIYGVGGGIVWDSDADDEYRECLSKAKVLATTVADTEFELLESIGWSQDKSWLLLDLHLHRLSDSARYFDFEFDRVAIERELELLQSSLSDNRYKIRLLLSRSGDVSMTATTLPGSFGSESRTIRLANEPVDAGNVFLYHKTTQRSVYDQALQDAADCDDVLLWNTDGFITESCAANVVFDIDGEQFTPPVSCGLLAGTYRQYLLQQGEIQERAIHVDELSERSKVTLINSVRGRMSTTLCKDQS
jgi:para-aminobenzoate synthetase/4-amino-4-deoxychorismate lyase